MYMYKIYYVSEDKKGKIYVCKFQYSCYIAVKMFHGCVDHKKCYNGEVLSVTWNNFHASRLFSSRYGIIEKLWLKSQCEEIQMDR